MKTNYIKIKAKKQRKSKYIKIILSVIISIQLIGCIDITGHRDIPTIQGKDLGESSKKIDEMHKEKIVLEQSEKYKRHFKNGLYFEDLSKGQKELNILFKKIKEEEIKKYVEKEMPFLKGVQYTIQTQVEYVNQDVKEYMQGKKKAEEIVNNPNCIMKINIYWLMFENFNKYEENETYDHGYIQMDTFMQNEWDKYVENGVEHLDIRFKSYDPSALKEHSIKELTDMKKITSIIPAEKTTFDMSLYKTYFSNRYIKYENSRHLWTNFSYGTQYIIDKLKEKYNIEFEEEMGVYFRAKKYKDVFFKAFYSEDSLEQGYISDHFQTAMYQYLAHKKLREIIDKAGLSDRVVFLATADPREYGYGGEKGTHRSPYNFGEGFDEDFFLREGYEGDVDITLIYLEDEKKKEGLEREQIIEQAYKNLDSLVEKIMVPLHKKIYLGFSKKYEETLDRSVKETHMYHYYVSDYDRKVILDLFKKYPLTESEPSPTTSTLADVFSLQYRTRAETQGFHYLDIFGGEAIEDDFSAHFMEEIYPEIYKKQ